MDDLNKIIEDAWKQKGNPEAMLKKFREVFKDYRGNVLYLVEYANALDFMGKEAEAIPIYKMAIRLGLTGKMKTRAEIQLGSSLSVTGENESAIDLLSKMNRGTGDPAALAFLCIALFRSGEIKRSLKTALSFILTANQGLIREYQRAISLYIDEIC
jgi:tetratricopeptide (TPR) repeat protein